tara:strand:- start:75 stop:902 length:828 start_codon:yes stop_codon:yes gene_type:complete
MKEIVPLKNLGRAPEHGRIRLGVKTERAMKSLDTFRFTSPDKSAIEQIATIYGGRVESWTPPRTKQEQWEVITTANELRVYLPPHSIDVWYEAWSGGGCQRRCDGVTAEVPLKTPDGMDIDSVPCPCGTEETMICAPYTRLRVILPDVRFGGVWRLESKGWNAANEMPGMASMLEQMQSIGLAECRLILEKRSKVSGGQTRHFVVPRLAMDASPEEIMEGGGQATALEDRTSTPMSVPALPPVIDAEIVEGWDLPPVGIKVVKNPDPPPKYLPAP